MKFLDKITKSKYWIAKFVIYFLLIGYGFNIIIYNQDSFAITPSGLYALKMALGFVIICFISAILASLEIKEIIKSYFEKFLLKNKWSKHFAAFMAFTSIFAFLITIPILYIFYCLHVPNFEIKGLRPLMWSWFYSLPYVYIVSLLLFFLYIYIIKSSTSEKKRRRLISIIMITLTLCQLVCNVIFSFIPPEGGLYCFIIFSIYSLLALGLLFIIYLVILFLEKINIIKPIKDCVVDNTIFNRLLWLFYHIFLIEIILYIISLTNIFSYLSTGY